MNFHSLLPHHNSYTWQLRHLGTWSQSEDCRNLRGHRTEELSGKLRVWHCMDGTEGVGFVSVWGEAVATCYANKKWIFNFWSSNLKLWKGELFVLDVRFFVSFQIIYEECALERWNGCKLRGVVFGFEYFFLLAKVSGCFFVCEVINGILHLDDIGYIPENSRLEAKVMEVWFRWFSGSMWVFGGMLKYQTRSELQLHLSCWEVKSLVQDHFRVVTIHKIEQPCNSWLSTGTVFRQDPNHQHVLSSFLDDQRWRDPGKPRATQDWHPRARATRRWQWSWNSSWRRGHHLRSKTFLQQKWVVEK